jgi:predicted PurR-regulated permease PerM
MTGPPTDPWSQRTRDLWFFVALGASLCLVVYLFHPFLFVLMFAGVTVVVTWPVYAPILTRCRGRRALAAVLTLLLLIAVVAGPLFLIFFMAAREAAFVVDAVTRYLQSGSIEAWLEAAVTGRLTLPAQLQRFVPADLDVVAMVAEPLRGGILAALDAVGGKVPTVLNATASALLNVVLYVFAVITLYMEGPRLLEFVKRLSPMEDAYEERLFKVFHDFANNMVLGSAVTAAIQGTLAAIGFAFAGVDRVVFLGILSALGSFVPLVGASAVWIPVAIYAGVTVSWGHGVGLAVYCIVLVGTVDNIVKPLFLRGRTKIHPLLIFLAVFGGMAWMGLPGLLVGPVTVAAFLALYTIYEENYLGVPHPRPARGPSRLRMWFEKLRQRRAAPPPAPEAPEDPDQRPGTEQ